MYDRENRGTDITSTQDKSARETIGSVCFEVFAFTEQDQDHCAVDDLEYWKLGYADSPVGASVGADKLGYLLVRKGEREKKTLSEPGTSGTKDNEYTGTNWTISFLTITRFMLDYRFLGL